MRGQMDILNSVGINPSASEGKNPKSDISKDAPNITTSDNVARPKLDGEPLETVVGQNAVREGAKSVAEETLSAEKLQELVDRLNQSIPTKDVSLKFEIDSVLDRPVMTVLDADTGQVLRQVPSDEVLRAIHNIDMMRGIIFDELS